MLTYESKANQTVGHSLTERDCESGDHQPADKKKEVNLRPHSLFPLLVSCERWRELVDKAEPSWSICASKEEWLAKLLYLRDGYQKGKIEQLAFQRRELRLVSTWVTRPGARARQTRR